MKYITTIFLALFATAALADPVEPTEPYDDWQTSYEALDYRLQNVERDVRSLKMGTPSKPQTIPSDLPEGQKFRPASERQPERPIVNTTPINTGPAEGTDEWYRTHGYSPCGRKDGSTYWQKECPVGNH